MDKHACLIANSQILCKKIDFVRTMLKPMAVLKIQPKSVVLLRFYALY